MSHRVSHGVAKRGTMQHRPTAWPPCLKTLPSFFETVFRTFSFFRALSPFFKELSRPKGFSHKKNVLARVLQNYLRAGSERSLAGLKNNEHVNQLPH